MPNIHPTAIVHPGAELADTVSIGPFTIVEKNVTIGKGTSIGAQCLIADGARIGENCLFHQGVVASTPPQDVKYRNEPTELFIGDNAIIREYCTLNRGTTHSYKTVVGSDFCLMAYAHVPHDAVIGDHVIIANAVQMGGHTQIGDWAIVGGTTVIHQFCRIGKHVMISAGCKIGKDIPPYSLAGRTMARFEGLNTIGLRRRGFQPKTIELLKETYHAIYHAGMNTSDGVAWVRANIEQIQEVLEVLEFIAGSRRGLVKATSEAGDENSENGDE
jgi:UDP-N-acetylglucosamine acyltransferase